MARRLNVGNVKAMTTGSAPKRLSEPVWLEGWIPAYPVPVSKAEVARLLTMCRETLIPARRQDIALALERVIDLFVAPKGWAEQTELYYQLLGDLPPDLLAEGVFIAMRDGQFFPKPAEIRAPVKGELARRRRQESKLSAALVAVNRQREEPSREPPTEAEKQAVSRIVAAALG